MGLTPEELETLAEFYDRAFNSEEISEDTQSVERAFYACLDQFYERECAEQPEIDFDLFRREAVKRIRRFLRNKRNNPPGTRPEDLEIK
jgi:hypothetical protein